MSPDKNDSQNEPKPEKKMGIDKGGLGHPDPEMRGGGQSPKNLFSALQVLIWPTNKGGGWAPSLYLPLNDSQASRPA